VPLFQQRLGTPGPPRGGGSRFRRGSRRCYARMRCNWAGQGPLRRPNRVIRAGLGSSGICLRRNSA